MRPTEDVNETSVCAVAVAYGADRDGLSALVASVLPQVDALVVVDNGGTSRLPRWLSGLDPGGKVHILEQATNIGLASAQNLGIGWARAHACTHVLLLDQDSVAGESMVATLLRGLSDLQCSGRRVAAVGPRFHDQREAREAPFVRVRFPRSRKMWCASEPYVRCDFLIASGALIPITVLDDVGSMDADLFIDNVDLEWSFRARSCGYELFGVCDAHLDHRLGDDRKSVLFGVGKVVVHSPIRLYYIMRNRVLLYRMSWTPRLWVAQDVIRIPAKFLEFSVLVPPRSQNVPMMLRGLADGVRGRRGPMRR
jgi:rhamnosyltransferase